MLEPFLYLFFFSGWILSTRKICHSEGGAVASRSQARVWIWESCGWRHDPRLLHGDISKTYGISCPHWIDITEYIIVFFVLIGFIVATYILTIRIAIYSMLKVFGSVWIQTVARSMAPLGCPQRCILVTRPSAPSSWDRSHRSAACCHTAGCASFETGTETGHAKEKEKSSRKIDDFNQSNQSKQSKLITSQSNQGVVFNLLTVASFNVACSFFCMVSPNWGRLLQILQLYIYIYAIITIWMHQDCLFEKFNDLPTACLGGQEAWTADWAACSRSGSGGGRSGTWDSTHGKTRQFQNPKGFKPMPKTLALVQTTDFMSGNIFRTTHSKMVDVDSSWWCESVNHHEQISSKLGIEILAHCRTNNPMWFLSKEEPILRHTVELTVRFFCKPANLEPISETVSTLSHKSAFLTI